MARYATFFEDKNIGTALSDLNGKRVKVVGERDGEYEVEVVSDRFEFTAYASELFEWSEL